MILSSFFISIDGSFQEKRLNKVARAREKKLPEKNFNDLVSFIIGTYTCVAMTETGTDTDR